MVELEVWTHGCFSTSGYGSPQFSMTFPKEDGRGEVYKSCVVLFSLGPRNHLKTPLSVVYATKSDGKGTLAANRLELEAQRVRDFILLMHLPNGSGGSTVQLVGVDRADLDTIPPTNGLALVVTSCVTSTGCPVAARLIDRGY